MLLEEKLSVSAILHMFSYCRVAMFSCFHAAMFSCQTPQRGKVVQPGSRLTNTPATLRPAGREEERKEEEEGEREEEEEDEEDGKRVE